jgi:hypothetical protein
MNSFEQTPRGKVDVESSVGIIRELYKPPSGLYEAVLEEVGAYELDSTNDVKVLFTPDSYVSLIDPDEILNLYDALHINPSEESLTGLADYFQTELPESFDEKIDINIRPVNIKHHVRHKDGSSADNVEHYWDIRSNRNDDLAYQRKQAKKAAYSFFEVSPQRRDTLRMKQIWTDHDTCKLLIASVVGSQNLARVTEWAEHSTVLGEGFILDKAIIDEV